MTIEDRANFGPTSHQQEAVQQFDRAWQQAQEQAKSAAWDTFGAAHYPFQDPKGFAKAVGDFAEEAIQSAADEIRDTYGAAKQWWNEITSITHTPCEDKWKVIIETALPAAGDAMYLLLTPSPDEILENYLQPYPSKTSRRGNKGDRANKRKRSRSGKVRRSWPGIPDVDSWAAAIIPGAAMVKGRKAGAPTRWTFDAIDRLDRVLWWFLILDVTKTFFNVWSSGMREARFCSQPWAALAFASWSSPPPKWKQMSGITIEWNVDALKGMFRNDNIFGFNGGARLSGTASVSLTASMPNASNNPDLAIRLWIQTQDVIHGTQTVYGPWESLTGKKSVTLSLTTQFTEAQRVLFDYQKQAAPYFPDQSSLSGEISVLAN